MSGSAGRFNAAESAENRIRRYGAMRLTRPTILRQYVNIQQPDVRSRIAFEWCVG